VGHLLPGAWERQAQPSQAIERTRHRVVSQ
jgi:hypothetical protein